MFRKVFKDFIKQNILCKSNKVNIYWMRQLCNAVEHNIHENSKTCDELDKIQNIRYGRELIKNKAGPSLKDFIVESVCTANLPDVDVTTNDIPYMNNIHGDNQKVYFDIYGCQMNVSDVEIIASILFAHGYKQTKNMEEANIVLIITCAIRDSAEQKIWTRLKYLNGLQRKRRAQGEIAMKIGLLGCMAERLKYKILDRNKLVDLIAGPDSYRDLPRLLANTNEETAINVMLSVDETYADVVPVRQNPDSISAYVSIMRGCDNMCTYCIVPFTRGRERSRPIDSIVNEVQKLSDDGVKEVTLLGQNVNSYRDMSQSNFYLAVDEKTSLAKGFKTVYKTKLGGRRFDELLDKVSLINPEMRIRFTAAHPKDFPDEVLQLIKERSNVCNQLHLPVQSGNSSVLDRMRRGYTREAYLDLVHHVRNVIPNVALSTDLIAGFCGETEEEFNDTLSLIELVKYNQAFLFMYSMREKTTAHRRYKDDVESSIKKDRLKRMIESYERELQKIHKSQVGQEQLVLIHQDARKHKDLFYGRTDDNTRVIIPAMDVPLERDSTSMKKIERGDYIVTYICCANLHHVKGIPLYHSSISEYLQSGLRNHKPELRCNTIAI